MQYALAVLLILLLVLLWPSRPKPMSYAELDVHIRRMLDSGAQTAEEIHAPIADRVAYAEVEAVVLAARRG